MKKYLSSLTIMVVCTSIITSISCSDTEHIYDGLYQDSMDTKPQKQRRSYEEALTIAEQSISMLDDTETRSGYKRHVNQADTRYILSKVTRANGHPDTLLYVFNFAENAGFAIVAANASATGLLAVTEEGNFNKESLEQNKGLSMFMDLASQYSLLGGFDELNPITDTISTILVSHVAPLIQVKWGQEFPEGLYCPNTVAGCNNTATALVTSYFEHPTHLHLTFEQRDTTDIDLNWDSMKQHVKGSSSYYNHTNCTASIEAHKNIGRLVSQITRYSSSQFYYHNSHLNWNSPLLNTYTTYVADPYIFATYTSTYDYKKYNALDSLGYIHTTPTDYTTKCTQSFLNNNWLVFMTGTAYSSLYQDYVDHAWIVDGYKYYKYTILDNRPMEPVINIIYKYYNHINWGWNGKSNGYFYDGVFDASNAESYDENTGISTYSFFDLEVSAVHL